MVSGTRMMRTCPNTECNAHGKSSGFSAFCDMCGTEFGDVNIPTQKHKVNAFDVMEDMGENLYCVLQKETSVFWVSNKSVFREKIARNTGVGELEGACEIDPLKIANEIQVFNGLHHADIEALRKVYDKVTIKWGVLGYWN